MSDSDLSDVEMYEHNPVAHVGKARRIKPADVLGIDKDEAARIIKPEIIEHRLTGGTSGKRFLGRTLSMCKIHKLTKLEAAEIAQHFPEADPGQLPSGNNIIVQIAKPVTKTRGGIILADESKQHQEWNEQTARVVALGPLAYHNPNTGEPYQEGNWCEPGDFVRIPKWGGDRSRVEGEALFLTCRDRDVISVVTGNPLTFRNRL